MRRASPVSKAAGISQLQVQFPEESALVEVRPSAINGLPRGETKLIWQIAPPIVWMDNDANPPGAMGEEMEIKLMAAPLLVVLGVILPVCGGGVKLAVDSPVCTRVGVLV